MATDIDSLQIQINATATKANTSIDKLVSRLDKLSNSLQGLRTGNLSNLSTGVQQLGTAMQSMNAVKTADFTRLAKNLNNLATVDYSKISGLATSIERIGRSFSGLSGVSSGASQMADLAKAISQLGYKSATQAITNIPQLATAMRNLMDELSRAPRVSQNLIDMTNALAKLARTGASSGRAATSLSTAFDRIGNSGANAHKGISRVTLSLSGLLKKILPIISLAKLFDLGKQSVELASDLTEVQNVVDATFGNYKQKIEDLAAVSIPELGMSELTAKQLGSRFQAIGTALGFSQGKMADMSVELTRLTGDMASFYNVSQEDVGKALQSIFTGETEPMRRYGVDLTNATIQQWALNNGLNANISSMSQAEKAMLRYQYTMERTAVAQGDFARTSGTWANQVRILSENLKVLGSTVGVALINIFKPLITWLNKVMTVVISAVKTIVNALGAIFGWELDISASGVTYDDVSSGLDDIASSADGAGSSMGGAADKAKELQKALLGFDEINKLPDESSSSGGSGGSGGGAGGGSGTGTGGGVSTELVRTESIFEAYKSELDSLYGLGAYIGNKLSDAMEDIDWESIYKKASGFGTGLANFLNGLISPRLFGNLGKTIASSINTALQFLNSFGETFSWQNFGKSFANGINTFFKTTDFKLAASTFNNFANGILDAILIAMDDVDWGNIGTQIATFLREVDWIGILGKVGKIIWRALSASIKSWNSSFNAAPIETTIITAILALKFTKLGGKTLGLLVWNQIRKSIFGSGAANTVFGGGGSAVASGGILASITAGLKTLAAKAGASIGGLSGFISEMFQVAGGLTNPFAVLFDSEMVNYMKSSWTQFFRDVGLSEIIEKWKESIFGRNGKSLVSSLFYGDGAETPELELEITAKDETKEGVSGAKQNLSTLPNETAVDVGANTKPATKSIDGLQDYTKNKALKIQKLSIPDSVNKKVFGLTEKYLTKNPVKLSTKIKDSDSEMQKKLEKFKNLELKPEVKTKTTAPVLQNSVGSLLNGYTLSVPTKIGTPSSYLQSQVTSSFSGFTLGINAKANVTEKDTSKLNKTIDGFTGNIGKKTTNGLSMLIPGFTGNIGQKTTDGLNKTIGGFTGNISKKTTDGLNKTISGITGIVSSLSKTKGLSLTLAATISIVGGLAKLIFNEDGGVYSSGSWKPITAYAGGGLPSQGQMFVAREAGPELVGTLGGHTAVMNNNQIVSSVSDGVYHAVAAAMSQFTGQMNGGGTPNITVYVGGRQVTDVVVEEVNQRTKATGMCPIMV